MSDPLPFLSLLFIHVESWLIHPSPFLGRVPFSPRTSAGLPSESLIGAWVALRKSGSLEMQERRRQDLPGRVEASAERR